MMVGGEVILTSPSAPTGTALYQIDIGFCQKENILNRGFSATANLFCTRDQFERIGKFDERLFSCGDREWAWRGASNGIGVCFEPGAQVNTAPRSSLRDAIRQARRVAAGRQQLRELALEHQGAVAAKRQRTALQSALWIFSLHHRSFLQKLKILFAAVMIGGAGRLERIRLRLGATPERR
jgi:hypothetical protein